MERTVRGERGLTWSFLASRKMGDPAALYRFALTNNWLKSDLSSYNEG